ncbi:hypothetical protein [Streptomyces cavernicola]|uniref:Uncharacterized protein n=1 Tax=Streptomyces cavernicola TaxID=3043613 RepID=A0ABT6S8D6_9ACTN|nr:hypothetical protein [Streptomyces sp. B-S-A6]MDI3404360.1 hypothetical protein [Streptomyces sp. B-S-A6]
MLEVDMENGNSPMPRPARPFAPDRPPLEPPAVYGRSALYGPPLGSECDLVTVPARQGLEAVDILRRGAAPAVGPVLHDNSCDTLGFLVPPGTADGWDLPGSACTQTFGRGGSARAGGRGAPAEPAPPVAGTGWLLPPADTGPVTDPTMLRAALGEAARLIEAADSCR